jgi:hypothetical protein
MNKDMEQLGANQADSVAKKITKLTKSLKNSTELGYETKEIKQEILERCAELSNLMICMIFH